MKIEPLSSEQLAYRVRLHCLRMTARGGSSHVGSALSIVDILAVLYSQVLRMDPNDPHHPERDRFVLSKGHAGAAVYATLAECGFFDRRLLRQHYKNGSLLSGHVSHKGIPGVEVSTGSLGHGLGLAAGFALSARMAKRPNRAVALLSDGELDEGSTWEAALFAAHHRLDNLLAVVDYNKLQSLTTVKDTLGLEPLADKWRSFGWRVAESDGHDHVALAKVLAESDDVDERPAVVIAHTTKGKGVSFMENQVLWHYRTARGDELVAALRELRRQRPENGMGGRP
jgi:transketolase